MPFWEMVGNVFESGEKYFIRTKSRGKEPKTAAMKGEEKDL